jgi:hypothetical protein|nr:MAG TPA: Transglutaminase-like superfamily [Caudoviricetes sp.]
MLFQHTYEDIRVNQEAKKLVESIPGIEEILDTLKEYTYGIYKKGKKSIVLAPDDVVKYQTGTCIDVHIYIARELLKLKYETKLLYLGNFKDLKNSVLHLTPIFKYQDKWYNLERTWSKYKKLHGPFESKEEVIDFVKNNFKKEYKEYTEENLISHIDKLIKMLPKEIDTFVSKLSKI